MSRRIAERLLPRMRQCDAVRGAILLHYGKVPRSIIGVPAERDALIMGHAVKTVFRLVGQGLVLS